MLFRNIIIPTLLLAAGAMTSCTIETSDNDGLDGFWHLEQVDTLATGHTMSLADRRVFWGVQAKLISVRDVDTDHDHGYLLRFRQTADSLITHSPYKDNWHEDIGDNGGDHPVDDPTLLAPYGINALEEGFAKERLSGGKMVLRSKTVRLHFKKF